MVKHRWQQIEGRAQKKRDHMSLIRTDSIHTDSQVGPAVAGPFTGMRNLIKTHEVSKQFWSIGVPALAQDRITDAFLFYDQCP